MPPSIKPLILSPKDGRVTSVMFLLHGLGDTGAGWWDVANLLASRPKLSQTRFILPNAPVQPVTLNMGMSMPSWFDITTLEDNGSDDEKGMLASVSTLKELIKKETDSGIDPSRIVVGGFSQGGAIALLTGLSHVPSLGGIVSLSSWLPLRSRFSKGVSNSLLSDKASTIPAFLAHGDADPVVRFTWGERTKKLLEEEIGCKNLSWNVYRGLQHGAHPQEIEDLAKWLESVIPPQA